MAINTQKFLPQGKGGGSLAVRPKTNLAPIKKQSSSLTKINGKQEDPMLVIKTKVIKIEDLLKGTLAAEKKAADDKRKAQEQEDRSKQEQDLETPKVKGKGIKIPVPKKIKSWWENIKSFFTNVLLGWLAIRLIDWLPKLVPILKFLAATADFIINWGGKILNGLVTFVDWGYKAVDATQTWIGDKFGEDAAKKFESFMSGLNLVMNGVIALGLAAAAMAGRRGPGGPRGPRRGPINQLKRLRTKVRRFINPNADAIKRAKRLKEIAKQRRAAEEALKRQRLLRRIRPTNVRRTAQVALEKTGRVLNPRNWKMPKVRTPGWMKSAGAEIQKRIAGADAWIKSIPARTRQMFDDVAKRVGPYIDEMGQGIANAGKSIGSKWTEVTENMKPQKVIDDLMAKVRPAIDDILKKNPIISKLLNNLKPKNARKAIQGLLTKAANNPALKKLIATLKANKGASKGLGPIDKIITALMALADYAIFKESPINAILKGLGGLFGYGVGFSAASAVPVLGQSGIFNFAGGMAGGMAGEWLAMKMAKVLAAGPLGEIDDPIMGPKDVEAGLPARKLVRDPDGLLDHMIKGVGGSEEPIVKDNFLPLDVDSVSKKANGVSEYTSYGDGSVEEVVVVNKQSSKVNNNTTNEGQIIAVNTGGGDSSDPYALNYRG